MTPQEYVQDRAARSGSSFYYAFLFLPPPRRAAITAFYAFCREVDDVVDEVSDLGVAVMKLGWWRSEIAASFGGAPSHPAKRVICGKARRWPQRWMARRVIPAAPAEPPRTPLTVFARFSRIIRA